MGYQKGLIGKDKDIFLSFSLDTWNKAARGSSARVFQGVQVGENGVPPETVAIKFMRLEDISYETPMFIEESAILLEMNEIAGVMKIYELGFMQFDNPDILSNDKEESHLGEITGTLLRYKIDSTNEFIRSFDEKIQEGWRAYFVLEKFFHRDNMLLKCSRTLNGRKFPLNLGIKAAYQASDIIKKAHNKGIVYLDHKIIHYYWDSATELISMIDWNVSERIEPENLEAEFTRDIVLFAVSMLYFMFTGRSHPKAPAIGPTAPDDLREFKNVNAEWEYDDEMDLPKELRDIIERALNSEIQDIDILCSFFENFEYDESKY